MSNAEDNNAGTGQGDIPTWDETYQFFRMQRWFRILVVLVIGLWIGLIFGLVTWSLATGSTHR